MASPHALRRPEPRRPVRAPRWPDRAPLGGLSPRRRVFVLGLVAVLVVLVAIVGTAVAREYAVPDPPAPTDMGTVVLVPGYGGNPTSMQSLAIRLEVIGRPAVVVDLPDGGTGDLVAQAAAIDDTVQQLTRRGETSVDLVGYSAGGVAAWQYLVSGRTAPAVRRVVTLGSPLQGAELAAAGGALVPGACPRACQQLAPGSSLLAGLAAQPRPTIPWLSLWTANDQTVTPPDSAALPDVDSYPLQAVCDGVEVSHSQLPTADLTTGLLLRALGTRPLPTADPGQCQRLRSEGIGRPVLVGTY